MVNFVPIIDIFDTPSASTCLNNTRNLGPVFLAQPCTEQVLTLFKPWPAKPFHTMDLVSDGPFFQSIPLVLPKPRGEKRDVVFLDRVLYLLKKSLERTRGDPQGRDHFEASAAGGSKRISSWTCYYNPVTCF